jgi:hypothetical protein
MIYVYAPGFAVEVIDVAVPAFTVAASATEVPEGSSVTFAVQGANVAPGTAVGYELRGVTESDIEGPLSGVAVLDDSLQAAVVVVVADDGVGDGDKTLEFVLERGFGSASCLLQDLGAPPPPPPPPDGEFFPPDTVLGDSSVPVAEPDSYRVWSGYGTKTGVGSVEFNSGQALEWDNLNGDWLDSNDVKQGPTPWAQPTVPKLTVGEFSFDCTALAQRWRAAGNRGAYLSVPSIASQSAWATVAGTQSATPPILRVVTADGAEHRLVGDLAGSQYTKATSSTPAAKLDSSQSLKLSRQSWALLHFDGVRSLQSEIVSAEVVFTVLQSDDVYPLTLSVFQANPPPLLMGGAGMTPVPGLAVEVGSEEALIGHPDVWAAGDFREENWNAEPAGVWKDGSLTGGTYNKPAKLFTSVSMNQAQFSKTRVVPDPGHPGRYVLDTCIATGQVGGGGMSVELPTMADMNDPKRPMLLGNVVEEAWVRVEVYLDPATFWSNLYSFKFSPVGMDLRMGLWDDKYGWGYKGGSTYSFGNGQTSADGRKYFSAEYGQWFYKGHSIRGHTMGHPHPQNAVYKDSIGLGFAPSHLGPYDQLWDGGIYGTEQNLRMYVVEPNGLKRKRQHVIPKGRWVTMETCVRINSVDTSVVDAYGNGRAINDGYLRVEMDGVLVGERSNLAFRQHPEMSIIGNWLMHHHGGNTPTDHDIRIWYRNFAIAKRRIGPSARLYANRAR